MRRYSTRTRAETTTKSLEANTAPETGLTDDKWFHIRTHVHNNDDWLLKCRLTKISKKKSEHEAVEPLATAKRHSIQFYTAQLLIHRTVWQVRVHVWRHRFIQLQWRCHAALSCSRLAPSGNARCHRMLESTSEIRHKNEHENEDPLYKLGQSEEIVQLLNLLHYAQTPTMHPVVLENID